MANGIAMGSRSEETPSHLYGWQGSLAGRVPQEFDTAYYALVSLAVFPKEAGEAEPFSIEVDYIRAYAP